jgi:DNA-binding Xre family transcriptional regulator
MVHRALDEEGMTRSDLARELGVDVQKLSRALDRPEYLTIDGLGRICAALEIELTFGEKNTATRRNQLRNKRLQRGSQ